MKLPDNLMVYVVLGLLVVTILYYWRKHKESEAKAKREAQQLEEEAAEQRRKRQQLLAEEMREREAEKRRLKKEAEMAEKERIAREESLRQREAEIAERKAEMARYEEEEHRQSEDRRIALQRKIDGFIYKYVKPWSQSMKKHQNAFDEDIQKKRFIFFDGTATYRREGFFDNPTFQQTVLNFTRHHQMEYFPGRDTPQRFSFFDPYLHTFERNLLEYAVIDYLYARKSGQIRYGNLKGNKNLGVDIILSDDESAFLIHCLHSDPRGEKSDMHAMIERFEKLESYRHDFLMQSYPELTNLNVRFMLVLGRSGTEGLHTDAYQFAKEKFDRILTLQGIVDFLDFEKPHPEAYEKYLAPLLPQGAH